MGPLNGDLEPGHLHVLHHFQQLGMLWAGEDGVISVENIGAILPDKDAWAGGQLDEANALELLDQVQEPDTASLFLAINVLMDLKDVISLSIHFASLGDLHVHIMFNLCLDVCHDVVDLQGVPAIDDGQDKNNPVGYWCICFVIIPPKDLVGSSTCIPLE